MWQRTLGINFFAGISTAFTCPFEGEIDPEHLLRVVRGFKSMGITQIGLADTLGTTPTERLMASVRHIQDAEPELTYYLHLHNAHGQALATVDAAISAGITRFDSALGGYGGCPFAPGAPETLPPRNSWPISTRQATKRELMNPRSAGP